jgi:hypothetical protein
MAGGAGPRSQDLNADANLGQRLAYRLRPLGQELSPIGADRAIGEPP